MTNPLLQKYDELYGKKEEPKKVEYELPIEFKTAIGSTAPITGAIGSTAPITGATGSINWIAPRLISSYDIETTNDFFLQIAEKVKDKTAVVTSVTMETGEVGGFNTELKTCTFEVKVYDTP